MEEEIINKKYYNNINLNKKKFINNSSSTPINIIYYN